VFLQVAAKDVGEKECSGDEYYYESAEVRRYAAGWSVVGIERGEKVFHGRAQERYALAGAS